MLCVTFHGNFFWTAEIYEFYKLGNSTRCWGDGLEFRENGSLNQFISAKTDFYIMVNSYDS